MAIGKVVGGSTPAAPLAGAVWQTKTRVSLKLLILLEMWLPLWDILGSLPSRCFGNVVGCLQYIGCHRCFLIMTSSY